MHNLTLISIAGLTLLAACNGTSSSTISGKLLMSEGAATSDGLSVTDGNVIVKDGHPGIAFAFATTPDTGKKFAYFLIFNHDFPNGGVRTEGSSDGSTAETLHAVSAFGNGCQAKYRVALKAVGKAVESETILIANTPYDPSDGKVFLINMKANPPTIRQVQLNLPSEVPDLKQSDATERFGEGTLKALRETDKTVDEFCLQCETNGA